VVSKRGNGTDNVVTITGSQTVWWFNGVLPTGYTTSIQLTAKPAGQSQYTWAFSAGSNKASFNGQTGNTINLTGSALSAAQGDVKVKVTVRFSDNSTKTSSDYPITVRGPKLLTFNTRLDAEDPGFGYSSHLYYKIRDNFNELLPSQIGFNEKWTTGVVNDYAGTNWTRGAEIGATTSSSELDDLIQGQGLGGSPVPVPVAPQYPFGTTKVQHWGQEHRVGSMVIGAGARVQTDVLQKYRDHANHESVQSPAP